MSELANLGGPVSAALEADLRTWVRRHQIVVWLDLDNHYSAFVDRLAAARQVGALSYEVQAFRGSHLALMLALEGAADGTEMTPMVIHLPGFNEESVRQTPMLELYAPGTRYRKALDTLVTEAAAGRVHPEQIDAFKTQPALTLTRADTWLASLLNEDDGGFDAQLRAMTPTAVFDDLLSNGFVANRIAQPQDAAVIWERIAAWIGLPLSWRETIQPSNARGGQEGAEDVAFATASWAFCVEYVDDLKRAPINPLLTLAQNLPRTVIDTCRNIAAHLRKQHANFYQRTADETEALLADEVEAVRAEDLGKIDTFRFEEDAVLKAALAALKVNAWKAVNEWAEIRVGTSHTETSFWLRQDPMRQLAWQLVQGAAKLGQAIAHASDQISTTESLNVAVDLYVQQGAAVDQAHRHLEQRRVELLYPQLPEFEALRTCLDTMRHSWRRWADAWACAFNELCRTHGFLPDPARQQRTLFDDVVKPMTQETGTTAYFVVDALRYEMGDELYQQLVDIPASTVQLTARLAELPTVTAVGMNVLAPVMVNNMLSPAMSDESGGGKIVGFSTGEFRVFDPKTRKRAMHDRVGGGTSPWLSLDDVVTRDSTSLKRTVAQARLVVVHSQEIDDAGEKGVGPAIFNSVMQKLRAAWHLLRDAGVRRFVFTADHGFLLLNESTGSAQPHGRKIDPMQRHVFSPVAADHTNEVRVPLTALRYNGVEGHLMFPENTAVFDTGRRTKSFVHGGNSLQERVIPVLTVVHRTASGGNILQYGIIANALEGVAGMHCLEITSEIVSQQMLDFGTPLEVELSLRVPEIPEVQVELIQTRGKATISGGLVQATVGETFELFFRLTGQTDTRVLVEVYHPSAVADVQPCVPDARFAVTSTRGAADVAGGNVEATAASPHAEPGEGWLDQLPQGGVRDLFTHLAAHGAVTESEAATMLGGQRKMRIFSVRFEEYAQKAPFDIRIDTVAGVKRYVREGSN